MSMTAKQAALAEQVEWFQRMYEPRNSHDARDFVRSLHQLVYMAQEVGAGPFVKELELRRETDMLAIKIGALK